MENCESLRKDIKTVSTLLRLSAMFRMQAAWTGLPSDLSNEMINTANSLCETALYILKKG